MLAGRLGRSADGWACELVLTGIDSEPTVRMSLTIDNQQQNQRLRARFLGVDPALIEHQCTDVAEHVENDFGGFVAFTLVRSVGTLQVGADPIATPQAQCLGKLEHAFRLGAR